MPVQATPCQLNDMRHGRLSSDSCCRCRRVQCSNPTIVENLGVVDRHLAGGGGGRSRIESGRALLGPTIYFDFLVLFLEL